MAIEDIIKFKLKRVNPFAGLVIDSDTWRDAHNYHRDQQRLHVLAFHKVGIVAGLEVIASNPPDLSVEIQPGMAVDPEGNVIIVPQKQRYQLQTGNSGTVYLVIQFREVAGDSPQNPEGGQPTRIIDAYRIEEREKLPAEPHLELARIDYDPAEKVIKDAKARAHPGRNDIDLNFRREVAMPAETRQIKATTAEPLSHRETISLGHAVLGGAGKDLHGAGWINLIKQINRQDNFGVSFDENVSLGKNIGQYTMLCLTGNGTFELTTEEQAALGGFLQSGGTIFGEGCTDGQVESEGKGAKEFGLAFNRLAGQLNCKLEIVKRGHPLLSMVHIFSDVPPGAATGMLLEGGHMVYSGSDYGCAWQGGHKDEPLPRDIIRSSIEMGANIVAYAQTMKATGH